MSHRGYVAFLVPLTSYGYWSVASNKTAKQAAQFRLDFWLSDSLERFTQTRIP